MSKEQLHETRLNAQLIDVFAGRTVYYEPRYEKPGFLHMQKQRRRLASR